MAFEVFICSGFVDLVFKPLNLLAGSLVCWESQKVGELLEGALDELALSPEIRSQISVGLLDGEEGGLHEVTHSLGASSGLGVNVLNTGELQDLLGGTGSNDTSTSGSGHKSYRDGTALASNLHEKMSTCPQLAQKQQGQHTMQKVCEKTHKTPQTTLYPHTEKFLPLLVRCGEDRACYPNILF